MYKKFIVLVCLLLALSCHLVFALAPDDIKVDNIKVKSGRDYKIGNGPLKVGTVYYIDRAYTVTEMPKDLEGVMFIMTANDDKSSVGQDFLKFSVDRPVVVWLACDSRGDPDKGGKVPEWLSEAKGWIRHKDMLLKVTDTNMAHFVMYSKDYNKGEIVLGGNLDPPASGQGSMYLVLLKPGKKMAVESLNKLGVKWSELKAK